MFMAPTCKLVFATNTEIPLFDSQDTVKVKVGPEERCFTIHRDLLRQSSPYFKSALDGGFKESHENVIILREDNPDVFELFVRWLYLQRLDFQNLYVEDRLSPRNLVQLYVFAEMRGVLPLKEIVIDVIIKRCESPILAAGRQTLREIPYVYEYTSEDSPLRGLLVDLAVVDYGMVTTLNKMKQLLPTEFLLDLAWRLKRLAGDRALPGANQLPNCVI